MTVLWAFPSPQSPGPINDSQQATGWVAGHVDHCLYRVEKVPAYWTNYYENKEGLFWSMTLYKVGLHTV